jgi:hypothetical protein
MDNWGFWGTLHLSANISVLRTVVRLNAQATIGPQLPLAAEPVRGLHLHYSIPAGGSKSEYAVWTYEKPYEAVASIKEYVLSLTGRCHQSYVLVNWSS